MKLIDEDRVIAEIDRRITEESRNSNSDIVIALFGLKSFLDTIEVKEVDLDKNIKEEYLKRRCYYGKDNMLVILNEPQFNAIAKHFFELGMKMAQKGEEV